MTEESKTYGQFCGLARSLDRVGDRWSLLIVRELLQGDRSFRELQTALRGISPSLLTKRLTELAGSGILVRNRAPRRSKNVHYRLTDTGRSLEPVVLELIRWGSRWMMNGPGDDHVDPRWAPLALRALLDGQSSSQPSVVHVDVDGVQVTLAVEGGRRSVSPGHHGHPDATIAAPLPLILAVAAGAAELPESGAKVSGDPAVATELLTPRNAVTS